MPENVRAAFKAARNRNVGGWSRKLLAEHAARIKAAENDQLRPSGHLRIVK